MCQRASFVRVGELFGDDALEVGVKNGP